MEVSEVVFTVWVSEFTLFVYTLVQNVLVRPKSTTYVSMFDYTRLPNNTAW